MDFLPINDASAHALGFDPPCYGRKDFWNQQQTLTRGDVSSRLVMKTLHIVDGESTGETLRRARPGREHEILCWRDALYTGPVPSGLTLRRLSRVRSQFWTNGKSNRELDKRDAGLLR